MAKGTKRGGKRPNSGPKAILTEIERLNVGSWCAAHERELGARKISERIDQKTLPAKLKARVSKIDEKYRALEAASDKSSGSIDVLRARWAEERMQAGAEIFGRRGRIYRVTLERQYGQRAAIIAACRKKVAQEWGKHVSAHTIDACWKEFAAFERSIRTLSAPRPGV